MKNRIFHIDIVDIILLILLCSHLVLVFWALGAMPSDPQVRSVMAARTDIEEPQREYTIDELIELECGNIDPDLIRAVIHVESRYDTTAVGAAGEIGLMQIKGGPVGARENIAAGANILQYLFNRFPNDTLMALTAYNMGVTGAVRYERPNSYAIQVYNVWQSYKEQSLRKDIY